MKKLLVLLTVVFVGSLIGSAVLAQAPEGKQRQAQRGGDPAAQFAAADTDNSGGLSLDEFKAMHEKRMKRMKERMGDRYDPERAAKRPSPEEAFKELDTNKDGSLSKEELAAGREKMRQRRGARGAPGGEGAGPRGPRGGGGGAGGAGE